MTLNPRQRTKVSAALSMIALAGHNPRTVQQAAQQHIARGVSHADAYTNALNAFARQVPAMKETLGTILELVQHSDEATLAKYDAAIGQFNNTGDNSALMALEPMIVEDFKTLIVGREIATAEDVAGMADWTIADALAFTDEAIAPEPWAPTEAELSAPADPTVPQSFTFEGVGNPGQPPAPQGAAPMPITPQQYAAEARELSNRLGGRMEGSPEYAALQARLTGSAPAAAGNAGVIQNGQATIPGTFTATGYRGPITGYTARSFAGTPIVDAG